jgi:hypothetical protein
MDAYVEEIRKLENKFSGLEINHVDRNNNVGADVLSNLGPLEQLFHQEFLSMNFTTHQSRNKANKPLTWRPRPQSEKC